MQGSRRQLYCTGNQELMSGEAAKERVTTAYVRVPSKYLSLRSEFPNKETGRLIKRQNDDTEKHVFRDNEVRSCKLL